MNIVVFLVVLLFLENDFKLEVLLCEFLIVENVWDIERFVIIVYRLNVVLSVKNSFDCFRVYFEVEYVKIGNYKVDIKVLFVLDVFVVLCRCVFNVLDIIK